jgi:glycosyltransferase involved in cell wall biosynthesis
VTISLDASFSFGRNLSGVGVYSHELIQGLARTHPDERFLLYYRPHRFLRSFREGVPANGSRRLLSGAPEGDVFHSLNQRVDAPGKRTVATFHDLFVLTGEYSTLDFRQRFAEQARGAAQRSDLIIAVSQFTAGQVESLVGVEASRIRVVPHGVHVPETTTRVEREPRVLFVGAIQRRKNVARLVRAFERLPAGWKLTLAGAADGFGAAEELAAVEASPRRGDIEVPGYVTADELASLYARASIFAFPSLDEGFGMPVLEAMAHGVPVVTSSTSALPEVGGDAALLVDPLDQEALGEALVKLAEDEALRAEMVRRGRERVSAFPWAAAVEKTWAVYTELT